MNNLTKTPPTSDELTSWFTNKLVNPRTGRKIKQNGIIYRQFETAYRNHSRSRKSPSLSNSLSKSKPKPKPKPKPETKPDKKESPNNQEQKRQKLDLEQSFNFSCMDDSEVREIGFEEFALPDRETDRETKRDTKENTKTICNPYLDKRGNVIDYDDRTLEYYRVIRQSKMDPFLQEELTDETAFVFPYKWDPLTGERGDIDPIGALYFDPDYLIKYFHINRMNHLWVQPSDESGGYYEGYFADGVGCGEQFFIPGRGHHPEWYLFRLPINDCYITKGQSKQYITMGPKLTDNDIKEIYEKANRRPNHYQESFGRNRPNLLNMKKYYDQAISLEPEIHDKINGDKTKENANRYAVSKLYNN
jgi:hypothetical protein